jgi:hypothetical protein
MDKMEDEFLAKLMDFCDTDIGYIALATRTSKLADIYRDSERAQHQGIVFICGCDVICTLGL